MMDVTPSRMAFLNAQMSLITRITDNIGAGDPLNGRDADPAPSTADHSDASPAPLPPTTSGVMAPSSATGMSVAPGDAESTLPPTEPDDTYSASAPLPPASQSLAGLRTPGDNTASTAPGMGGSTSAPQTAPYAQPAPRAEAEPGGVSSEPQIDIGEGAGPARAFSGIAMRAGPALLTGAPPSIAEPSDDAADPHVQTSGQPFVMAGSPAERGSVAPPFQAAPELPGADIAAKDGVATMPDVATSTSSLSALRRASDVAEPKPDAAEAADARDDREAAIGKVSHSEASPSAAVREQVAVIRHETRSDIDLRFFSDAAGGAAAAAGVLETGIIPSFILNAAMIPGWPPPRPFEMPSRESLLDGLLGSPTLAGRESELAALLSGRSDAPSLGRRLSNILKRLARSRRLRVLLGLAVLSGAIETVLDAIEQELLQLARSRDEDDDDLALAEGGFRRQLSA